MVKINNIWHVIDTVANEEKYLSSNKEISPKIIV